MGKWKSVWSAWTLCWLVEYSAGLNLTFQPADQVRVAAQGQYTVHFALWQTGRHRLVRMRMESSEAGVIDIRPRFFTGVEAWPDFHRDSFVIRGRKVADTRVTAVGLTRQSTRWRSQSLSVRVTATTPHWLTYWFDFSVAFLVSFGYVHLGLTIDLNTVGQILKKPVAPAVGFICQFLVMPSTAYLAGRWLFSDDVLRFGLFVYGCSPGGGTTWTVILRGNYHLSITVSFVNSLAALGLIPLWMWTVGSRILENTQKIPMDNLLISLASMIVPVGLGLLLQYLFPRVRKTAARLLLPVTLIILLYLSLLGLFAYAEVFRMITWPVALASLINVGLGFLIAALVSKLLAFPTPDTVALAVDTGVQNAAVALVLVSFSFDDPALADLAKTVPVTAYALTPCPLLLAWLAQRLYRALTGPGPLTAALPPETAPLISGEKNPAEKTTYSTF